MAPRPQSLPHSLPVPLPMSDTTFDTIIIGGGTAGALLANRLSASGRQRVLLIEAGRKDDYHWIHIPVGYLYCIGNPRTDWLYNTEPDAGLNGRTLRGVQRPQVARNRRADAEGDGNRRFGCHRRRRLLPGRNATLRAGHPLHRHSRHD